MHFGFGSATRGAALALLLGVCHPIVALAGITGILGDITEIAPPVSVELNALVSDTTMSVFAEQTNYVLPVDVDVDILGLGLADDDPRTPAPTAGTIPAGTRVDVYMVHFDSPGDAIQALVGEIGFDADVLGAIHSDARLDDSDFLGAPGTSYPAGVEFRGMVGDMEGTDWVEVGNTPMGPRNVGVNSNVEFVLDQVRIITAAGPLVPEPTSLFFAVFGWPVLTQVRRRR
jgi:hypothetical protein